MSPKYSSLQKMICLDYVLSTSQIANHFTIETTFPEKECVIP